MPSRATAGSGHLPDGRRPEPPSARHAAAGSALDDVAEGGRCRRPFRCVAGLPGEPLQIPPHLLEGGDPLGELGGVPLDEGGHVPTGHLAPVHDLRQAGADRAAEYGVKVVPALVVDGTLLSCCRATGPAREELSAAGIGQPLR